jgi:poly[(R)-3-hydroxyalkanoate] polymerase subunit PhaC
MNTADLEWQTGETERHYATTDDGWELALYRYAPTPGSGLAAPVPVVMGHGMCGSRLIFDCDERSSLARFLAGRGFDTWLVDLRGRLESWPPGRTGDPTLQWCFDDFALRDLPAAIDAVCEVAGAPGAFWVGTETSGIALYAAVLSGAAARVRGGITLGAPAVTRPDAQVPGVTTGFPERAGSRYPFSMVRDIGPALAAEQSPFLESSFRPVNMNWIATARYFRHGVPDEASALVGQYRDWIESGTMRSHDGTIDWSQRLGEFMLPILVGVGAADLQRPPDSVRETYEALGSADKTFRCFGRSEGCSTDFGHDDLIVGRDAPTDVYPAIARWLEERV